MALSERELGRQINAFAHHLRTEASWARRAAAGLEVPKTRTVPSDEPIRAHRSTFCNTILALPASSRA